MAEYVCVRASEILGQKELVAYLKSQFPRITKQVGRSIVPGTECVEARVLSDSSEFYEIREFIGVRRKQHAHGFSDFSIGRYIRTYTKKDLLNAEILLLKSVPHFEPCGEECGTVYELCATTAIGVDRSLILSSTFAMSLRRRTYRKPLHGSSGLSLRISHEPSWKTSLRAQDSDQFSISGIPSGNQTFLGQTRGEEIEKEV